MKSETNTIPTLQQPDVVTSMVPQMSSAALQIPSQMLAQYTLPQGSPRILAPQLPVNLPFQIPPWHTTASSNTLASNFSSYTHAVGPALPQQAPAPSWNAGMSPNAYEVVVTPTRAQKYYGCGNDFSPKYKTLPTNIIIKHVDRRVTRRNKQTGKCTAVISAIHITI